MTTRKPLAFLCALLTALGAVLASLAGSSTANAQFLPVWFGQGVVLEASDILDEGVASQSLKVTYYNQINPASLGDDEIWVVSPEGFNAFAKLEGFEEVPREEFPENPAFDEIRLFNPTGEPFFPWLIGPSIVAHYSLAAPDGNAWSKADNGSYSVLVAPKSVSLEDGGFVEHQLLGTFGVRVGEPLPVKVKDWSINIVESRRGCDAKVRLKFESATEVEWGEVMRDGNRLFVRIEAKASRDGSRNASHSYPLGDLPGGDYLFEVRVNDRLLDVKPFVKRDDPLEVPAEIEVAVVQSAAQPLTGQVGVKFLEPGWMVTDPGKIVRRGNRFFVDAKARLATDVPEPESWSMDYEIPQPEPGIYSFTFCLNGQVCDSVRFEVAGPDGRIRVRDIHVAFTGAVACPEGLVGDDGVSDCFYDHVAAVTVALSPQIAVVNWGTPERLDDRNLVIDIETAAVPGVPNANGVVTDSHRYDLGLLEEGRWVLTITSNGKRLARERFVSPASSGVMAKLRTEPLDPTVSTHQFHVIYSGPSKVNVDTLGDDDIQVFNPIIQVMSFVAGEVPDCLSQFAKLVSFEVSADGASTDAIYSIKCTDEEWARWGALHDFADGLKVFLVDGGVETQNGQAVEGQDLGIIPFKKSDAFNPRVLVHAPPVHEPNSVAEIQVSYISGSPIDVESLGDGDIAVFDAELIRPDGSVVVLPEPLFASLREFNAVGSNRHIEAIYTLTPDADGWTSRWNGQYILTLVEGALTNQSGQASVQKDIGDLFVDIEPDLVIGDAKIAVRMEGDKVFADVGTELRNHTITDWGTPVLRGNTFFLDAAARVSDAGSQQEHTYQLLPHVDDPNEEPIDFEVIPDEAAFPFYPMSPLNIVIRNVAEWEELISENWHPLADAGLPEPPVDFASHMIVGVALGEQPEGFEVQISKVVIAPPGNLVVHYDEIVPGVAPPDGVIGNPFELVSVPQIDLPVLFKQDVIALPGPAPEEDVAIRPADPLPHPFPLPPFPEARFYQVVFRVNGQELAKSFFSRPNEGGIIARAWIDIEKDNNGVVANVNVAFPGFPYYHIVDWGNVRRDGNSFFLPAKAEQIDFIVDPGVVEQSHRYRLIGSDGGNGEPIPFEPLEIENWNALEARNLVIQTPEEWADAWSSSVPIDGLPPEPPVDLDAHTLLGVLQGPKPNGCYGVRIVEVTRDANGAVTVAYESIVPTGDQVCTQAIVHPQSFVVVSKIDGPVTFVERPADSLPLADPLTNEGGFRIVPPFSQRYQVYFLINDVIYAHSEFTWRRPIPRPKPQPVFDVAIEAEGGVNEAVVHVELSTQEGLINKIEWGEPVINGHSVKANVAIDFTPWSDLPEADFAPQEPFVYAYELADLRSGFHTFRLSINGKQSARAFFLVTGDGVDPLPFERWLAKLFSTIDNATMHGLAEVFGDLDGDGTLDMEEFFLGTDPLKRDVPAIRPEWVRGRDGKSHLAICFQRRKDAAGVTAVVEASQNLRQWLDSPELFDQISVTDLGNGLEEVVICIKQPTSESPFQFLRLHLHEDHAAAVGQ